MTTTTTPTIETLRTAIEKAGEAWTGLDWDDSDLQGLADRIRDPHKSVDVVDGLRHYLPTDGGDAECEGNRAAIATLKSQIEDCDFDGAQAVEALAVEAERLAQAERDAVESRADDARELGERALEAAEAGDLDKAVRLLDDACTIEARYGDAPAWRPARDVAKQLRDLAEAEEPETRDEPAVVI